MQRMLKRGMEMLRMEDYQILYCGPGLATGDELERLKIMSSSEYFVRLAPMPADCGHTLTWRTPAGCRLPSGRQLYSVLSGSPR